MATVNLSNIEIFRTGMWKGRAFTRKDLEGMVSAFQALTEEVAVPVKITHESEDTPNSINRLAWGWVSDLRLGERGEGSTLIADLYKVAPELADALQDGRLKGRSIELFVDYRALESGASFPLVLKAVSFLGAQIPAVPGLAEITFEAPQETEILTFSVEALPQPSSPPGNALFYSREDVDRMLRDQGRNLARGFESQTTSLRSENLALKDRMKRQDLERRVNGLLSIGFPPAIKEWGLLEFAARLPESTCLHFSRNGESKEIPLVEAFFDFVERFCLRYSLEEQAPDGEVPPPKEWTPREKELLARFEEHRTTLERLGFSPETYLRYSQPLRKSLAEGM